MTLVSYDSRAVTLDGRRQLVFSGAVHYPRSTPQMWPELMKRSRLAGLNTIETYVFWNLHERRRGVLDFSDRLDLRLFCTLAQDSGLNVILRIGPYICAETNYGGLPAWLRDVPGIQMRTWNQPFMREMERWMRLFCEYIRPALAPNGGPIILAQVENEYDNLAPRYGEEGKRYVAWCVELSRSLDLGIPWVMCSGAAPGVIETINGFYGAMQIDKHFEKHPDLPALWTENWPGWYNTWTVPRHRRTPENVAYAVARFFAAGGTGVNYYMWHGGTNFGRDSMYLQTTSYDFDAPLDEYGQPTTKLHHLARLHLILADHADVLLADRRAPRETVGEQQSAWQWGTGERALLFLCNDAEEPATVTRGDLCATLAPRSVKLYMANGRLLMDTAEIADSCLVQRTMEPAPAGLNRFEWLAEPLPADWPDELAHPFETPQPIEQLRLTHDETDYCWYLTELPADGPGGGEGQLVLDGCADVVHVFVDGKLEATTATPLMEDRGEVTGEGYRQRFTLSLSPGRHELALLCCSLGLIKGDWMLGFKNMVNERKGIWGHVLWNGRSLPGPWRLQPGLVGERCGVFSDGGALARWRNVRRGLAGRPLTWLRTTFDLPEGEAPLALDLGSMGKGMAWLNGRCLGRYWIVPATGASQAWLEIGRTIFEEGFGEPTQRYYHLPVGWLQPRNTLVLFEELGGEPDGIQLCQWR